MEARYARNIPALSPEECRALRGRRVLVAGCGGLGGHLLDMLARVGIGAIRAVDGDVFEASNLNRQLLSELSLLGRSKAHAAAAHVCRVNPDVEVEAVEAFLTQENAAPLLAGCDAALDALDNIESRRLLADACAKAGVPYIYGAVSGWVGQAAVCMPGDGLVEQLYPAGVTLKNKSVLSFTPPMCAAMQASLCVKLLLGRPVEAGKVYYFDLLNQEFETFMLG